MPRQIKKVNDTPVQSWAEREKTVTANESSRRESEGEIPVELIDRQPFDDFPLAHGVSRTNGVLYIAAETRTRENNLMHFAYESFASCSAVY